MFLDSFGCDKLIRFSAELLILIVNINVFFKLDNAETVPLILKEFKIIQNVLQI